ncbi:hypothetical protein MMC32_001897 [Xylographa parallela]|nr:hypothetical protein [Xylographa parallela]
MSFGVGIGDCIRVFELIDTIVETLRHAGRANSEFQTLTVQLTTLRTALLSLENIDVDNTCIGERLALRQASFQCQRTIDDFWKRTIKYQPYLQAEGSGSHLKDIWKKLKWTRCKEDLADFEAQIAGHTASIQLLLSGVEMANNERRHLEQSQAYKTVNHFIQEMSFECLQRLDLITSKISRFELMGLQQGRRLIETATQILYINVQIFQKVSRIHSIITTIPGQIERQQPVYLIDALGKYAPFHLEFIRSPEALTAVLKANLSKTGSGPEKIDRGEFALQDTNTKRQIMLTDDWETCFFPGQHVDMSMGRENEDIECSVCGMNFQRIVKPFSGDSKRSLITTVIGGDSRALQQSPKVLSEGIGPMPLPRNRANAADDIQLFRRVRVIALDIGGPGTVSVFNNVLDIEKVFCQFIDKMPEAREVITESLLTLNTFVNVVLVLNVEYKDNPLLSRDSLWELKEHLFASLGFTFKDINRLFGFLTATGYPRTANVYESVWKKMNDYFVAESVENIAERFQQYYWMFRHLLKMAKE